MSEHQPLPSEDWAHLNHGGLLISPAKLDEFFPTAASRLPAYEADRLRRALTAFDGSSETLGRLLDYVLQDLIGLPAQEWQKAQEVDSRWALRSFTGVQLKPRRLWQGPQGETLAVFTPDEGGSRQYGGRLGVGRSRQLLGRVLEWLRRTQQPLAMVTNGRQWRLLHAGADYDAWCEWDIDLWFVEGQPSAQTRIWRTLLLRENLLSSASGQSSLLQAISASRKGQAELSNVLGERVRQGVEELVTASHTAIEQALNSGQTHQYQDLYVAGARIIMRCIITLFAEARGLLPVDNAIYQQAYSLEGLRHQLDRRAGGRGNERLSQGRSAWPRLISLFNLIYQGSAHERLAVPRYGGALFEPGDPASEDGIKRALALLESSHNVISDHQVHKLLRLLTRTKMKVRQGRSSRWVDAPVDFSTLSSEYIGILYEGLLDFELKQAAADDPVVFLAVGNQPALTLSQLENMDDASVKELFKALKNADQAPGMGDDDEGGESDEEADTDVAEEAAESDEEVGDDTDTPGDSDDLVPEDDSSVQDDSDAPAISADHLDRAQAWLAKAAVLAGFVRRPRGRRNATTVAEEQQALATAARQLCARLVAPGQFYLVRWGGTRKGAGTFYTRPQLVAPTVRRTLQPLAYDAVRTEIDPRTQSPVVLEWSPKRPEDILGIKVCDPAMGSGSFLAGALRYLTDALTESLYHHQLIQRSADGGVPRMADGKLADLLSDELPKLNPREDEFEEALRAQLKRHVVENCLYGVDIDPLAVELGRMALWVETMDRNLPFGFLDHKLKVGNALVGAWFDTYRDYPAMAWQREGGDKDYQKNKPGNLVNHHYIDANGKKKGDVFTDAIKTRSKAVPEQLKAMLSGQLSIEGGLDASNVHDELLKVLRKLHRLPVHESEKRAQVYRNEVLGNPHYHALKARMDLWCALWFWPGQQIELAPLPRDFTHPGEEVLAIASEVARRQRFFHWELEFPDVFTASHEGFDALLGNPPWETMQPNSKEFFSNHDPLYRAYGKQEALAKQLSYFRDQPQLEHAWIAYMAGFKAFANWMNGCGEPFGDHVSTDNKGKQKHDLNLGGRGANSFVASAALHKKWQQQRKKHKGFTDVKHPFIYQGSGKPYLQKMFLELSHALLKNQGRFGMIVPSGVYTDKGATALRTLFLEHCDWQWLFGFENRDKVFDIDSRFKFCPLIVQKGGRTESIRAAFMHRDVDDWEQAERYVLAYPRAQVEEFSPYSKSILEIRNEQDLRVLQKVYANGVLLGDQSDHGWGVKYLQGDFNMTSDSKLFPPRPKWEQQGYQPDEYGHWLKGPWDDYNGPSHILERPMGVVLSRDGKQAMHVDFIEDVALPLLEGNIIDQFQVSSKGWVSGKGRSAVWRTIAPESEELDPQYLISLENAASKKYKTGEKKGQPKWRPVPKVTFIDVTSATNTRTARATCTPYFPCGNTSAVLDSNCSVFAIATAMNSFVYDFVARARCGGLHLNWFVIEESILPKKNIEALLDEVGRKLIAHLSVFNFSHAEPIRKVALSRAERMRQRCISDAVVASSLALSLDEFSYILTDCDYPKRVLTDAFTSQLNAKGFWRIDKDQDPELRHTVLSLVAFDDLQQKGLDDFLAQNDGEGWMIPEQLRLADYGLGHDERAKEYQPVASRLGSRFYDWKLNEDVERSWKECAAHAELIRRIVPLPDIEESTEDAQTASMPQGDLF